MVALRIFLFFLLIDCNAQKLELHNKEKLAKVLEDIRARIISDDDVETVEGSGFSSDEQFVANLVVRPGFPVSQHKPKLEFMPHFEHENFEFMVPEGVSEKSSVMAILPFYSILDSAVPEFKLNGNGCEYLEIGDLTVTQTDNYALAEVPIIKKKGINFLYGNGSYSLWITATQRGMENKAKLSIEVIPVTGIEFLSIRPGSLELTDAGEYSDIVGSGEEPANQKQVPPELEIVVSGAKDGIFSISENLPRFSKIPNIDIQVHFKDHSIIQDYIELSIEPSDLFAPRPQIVSPGEPVKLVVLDSNLLDFEVKPSELTFKLNARLRGKWKEITQKSVILKAEKVDESDQAPIFEREHYLFVINTTYGNNAEVGEIKASDPDSSQNIQYTLLGEGSSTFKLDSGVLIIDCGMAEKCFDQEKEYHLLAMAVDQTGRTSKPASIVIKIESTLADECYIETSRKELTVKNGHLITPLNFIVNNLRRNSIPKFDVKLEGKGAKYFEIEKLTRRLHNLKLIDDIPDGIYVINIILSQQSGKQRTTITVTSNTEKKIELEQKKYSINLNDIPIYRGQSIINLKTNGKHQNGIRYVIKGSKDWISLNTKTGEIIVTRVPEEDQNVNLKVVAYNKKTGKVIDKATVNLQYKTEKVKTYQVPESRVLYYNKDGLKFKKEKGLKTRKIVGYTHNQREVLVSNGSYNGDPQGEMFISNDMLKSFLFMQIFFVSSDNRAVVYSLLNENTEIRQKPAFGYPWISDFDEIKVKITDESHDFICLPCIHKGNIIDNVTLQADQKVIFNKTNGCLNVASRITEEHQIQLECWGDGERTLATIRVAPASETLPFDLPFKTISVEENIEPDTIIARYSIKDTFKYMYKISGDYSDFFEIQLIESEVIIKTNHKVDVDYEAIKSMPLFVTVSDQEENSKIGVLQINVIDQNDNYPIIASSPKLINIYNHWDKNVTVGLIKASDLDDGDNGRLEYRMLEPVLSFLDIDHEHGIIKTSDSLDKFAREEHYQLSVKVTDHGNPAKSAITDIPVFVHTLIDSLNKQIQIISPSESCVIEISEDEKINTTVFKAKAVLTGIELDDALLKYYISSESEDFSSYFKMDEEMGAMSLIRGLDYEESAHFTVKLEVKSLLSGVSPAYRLLNITVINVDEHQPHFSLSEAERIIYLGNETIALRAEDDDLPPFNSIYYYLLPKCGNTKFAEINDISGKLAIKNNIPDGSKICVYASPIKLNDDIGSIYYDKHNKAMIKIIIKRADLTPSSTSIFLDSDLRQQSIDLKIIEPSPDLHYHLKSIRFYPLKGAPVDVNDLISVDSGSGVLLFEPRIIDEPEGTYQININLHGLGDVNSPVQHLVYYIRDYNQLRFVFDNSVDNVGLNLEAFKHQLEVILSSQRRRNVTVINGRSCGLTESNRKKKTKICFFLTEQDKILDYDTSLDWLSTTSNANPRLIDLYSKFRVVDVDRCLNINSLLLHSSTSSLDREQLVWLFVIFCLITLIILLISYSCLVKRVKDRVNNGFFNAL